MKIYPFLQFWQFSRLSKERIGPHHQDVISTLVGSLLGDGWGEARRGSARFHIHMSSKNMEYINSLHAFFSSRGYCGVKPKISRQIAKGGAVYHSAKMRTYSFSSLLPLFQEFYPEGGVKRVPKSVESLLTPQALAIWYMDDGGRAGEGCKLSTEAFPLEDVSLLQSAIRSRYSCECTIQRHKERWCIYIPKGESATFAAIVRPFMVKSMYYKLQNYSKS